MMTTSERSPYRLDSLAVHAGHDDLGALGVHALPIDLSTTAPLDSIDSGGLAYEALASGSPLSPGMPTVYRRAWNATVARFEGAIAALEQPDGESETVEAVAFASGMAAMAAVLLSRVQAGLPHVVAVRPLYGGTDHLLATGILGTTVTFVDADSVQEAIGPATGLVVVESPANPTLDLLDIRDIARQAGSVPVLVDNTFATPVLQRPLGLGAAFSLHSATKYIGGHGDAMGGVVATRAEYARRLRPIRTITGGVLDPWSAYLLHRGLPTLPLRIRAQQASAARIAEWLAQQIGVSRVFYPGLAECDPRGLVGTQMTGPGAMVAFELAGGFASAERLCARLSLVTHAVSLGGVDTLIQHPAALTHRPVASTAKPGEGIMRLSVGLEDVEDVIADLARGLA
ncbi:MAG: PLP-dependent transferase [Actinomycetota bacterium]|nr:PLP-dependent transferase [Actinomycetota bacterium]